MRHTAGNASDAPHHISYQIGRGTRQGALFIFAASRTSVAFFGYCFVNNPPLFGEKSDSFDRYNFSRTVVFGAATKRTPDPGGFSKTVASYLPGSMR